jgi:hypothetical protein
MSVSGDFHRLLVLAQKYTATHNTDRTRDQLAMEWMRHKYYAGITWNVLIGGIDNGFISFFEDTGMGFNDFYEDPFYQTYVDYAHLTATMNGVYIIGQPSSLEISRADVAG